MKLFRYFIWTKARYSQMRDNAGEGLKGTRDGVILIRMPKPDLCLERVK